jgi:hypothetical protein
MYLPLNYKNEIAHRLDMTTFSERVKNAWKNIYPLQETETKKKNKKR